MEENTLELKDKIRKLMSEQTLAVLATLDVGYPYHSLVAYLYTEDLKFILFATMVNTNKYHNIQNNPMVSMLIDNRNNDGKDFEDAVALTITGKTKVYKKEKYFQHYIHRFPFLKKFLENTQTVLIQLKVDRYLYVQNFQEVLELKMK